MKISLKFFIGLIILNLVFPGSVLAVGEDLAILSDESPATMATSSVEAVQEKTLDIIQNSLKDPNGDLGGLYDQIPVVNVKNGEPTEEKEDGRNSSGDGGMTNAPVAVEAAAAGSDEGFRDPPPAPDEPKAAPRTVALETLASGRRLTRDEGILAPPLSCRGKFATFLVYRQDQDWQRAPEDYKFNRAFACATVLEPLVFDFSFLEPGAYVFLRAEQDESGSWRAPIILANFVLTE